MTNEGAGFPGAMRAIDHATVWVERPIQRVAGSSRLNPLPHAGTISVFLLAIVTLTGLYLTLFFQFGYEGSYEAVADMEDHAIQRVARALHRYASAALVLTIVVHAWRIFAASRFSGGQRSWRWTTGVAALVLVWMAGVTGYWLVWDARAQAINEIVVGLVASWGRGTRFAVDQLGIVPGGSGSGFLLFLWFLHLGLTAVIIWFTFRHLRRSKLPWIPPRHWMLLMGGALLLVSLALPVGMLGPARPDRLVEDMPLDPFVLFLLPPLLSDLAWLTILGGIVALGFVLAIPRLFGRGQVAPIEIEASACTGCELCVVDCPYDALTMDGSLAVVDSARCVACGICLGSCAFGAIELPGWSPIAPTDVEGSHVVIACDRHETLAADHSAADGNSAADQERVLLPVRCAGMLAPDSLQHLVESGAADVQVVGCAPGDCRYGVGNQLASERLSGTRRPHPARKYARAVTQDWVTSGDFDRAVQSPGSHPDADAAAAPGRREALVGAGFLVALSAVGVALATRAPFRARADDAAVRVVVDHVPGRPLLSDPEGGPVASIEDIEVLIDGSVVHTEAPLTSGATEVAISDVPLSVRPAELEVVAVLDDSRMVVHRADLSPSAGDRIVVDITDLPVEPGASQGREIFSSRSAGCTICHSVEPGDDGVGPSLAGVGAVAGERVEGLTDELYLRQSILLPDQYIVDGWPAGQMLPIYRDRFDEQELEAVITYLLSLDEVDR